MRLGDIRIKILCLDSNDEVRQQLLAEFNQPGSGFHAIGAATLAEARELLVACDHSLTSEAQLLSPQIVGVLTEWSCSAEPVMASDCETKLEDLSISGLSILQGIRDVRPDVDIFVHTRAVDQPGRDIWLAKANGMVNGIFIKGDQELDELVSKMRSEIYPSKIRAPFWEALSKYVQSNSDAFHTPGHSSGDSLKRSPWCRDFYTFFGRNAFLSDLSVSVPELDSLLHPKNALLEAQELAASTFGARHTRFVTNGTSTANKIVIQTLLRPGDHVLVDRNCHKSVHYAIQMAGAIPFYLSPTVNDKFGIFGPIAKQTLQQALARAKEQEIAIKLLIVTNCTYDGLSLDIADFVSIAHSHSLKVMVDEAWYSHARFHHRFGRSALAAGADWVTQSTHKTLSAFSQASLIHINDPHFKHLEDKFEEMFLMHSSTSPNYHIIASLDVARKQVALEGFYLLDRTLRIADSLRLSLRQLKRFRPLELEDLLPAELASDRVSLDPTKVTIDVSESGLAATEVQHLLHSSHGIQIEKLTFSTISILITIGTTVSKVNRLCSALQNIEQRFCPAESEMQSTSTFQPPLACSVLRYQPQAAFYAQSELLPIAAALDRISTRQIVPYPPGIPLLVPGSLITQEIIDILIQCHDNSVEVHGVRTGQIAVMLRSEEAKLYERGDATSSAFIRATDPE